MKKLGKNLNLVERTVEAYECNCACSGCPCSCGSNSSVYYTVANGAKYEAQYDGSQVVKEWS